MFGTSLKKLIVYVDRRGKEPFVIWLESIRDSIIRARIKNYVRRLEFGHSGDYKSLGKGLFELRLHFGAGYRVYIGNDGETIIILLCGGDKHSQVKDIAQATKYWEDYKNSK